MHNLVQDFEPVKQPSQTYGKFYEGDSYIVLKVYIKVSLPVLLHTLGLFFRRLGRDPV